MIVIENIKISNMSKVAKGTAEQDGQNVGAKSDLNRSILDQGWYEMRRQFEYKQFWHRGRCWETLRPIPAGGAPAAVILLKVNRQARS